MHGITQLKEKVRSLKGERQRLKGTKKRLKEELKTQVNLLRDEVVHAHGRNLITVWKFLGWYFSELIDTRQKYYLYVVPGKIFGLYEGSFLHTKTHNFFQEVLKYKKLKISKNWHVVIFKLQKSN